VPKSTQESRRITAPEPVQDHSKTTAVEIPINQTRLHSHTLDGNRFPTRQMEHWFWYQFPSKCLQKIVLRATETKYCWQCSNTK